MNEIDKGRILARASHLHQQALDQMPIGDALMHVCQRVAELEMECERVKERWNMLSKQVRVEVPDATNQTRSEAE